MEQAIQFCTTPDGVRIAYAVLGDGLPLIKVANWLNHLEYDWQTPIWRPVFEELAAHHQLVRYDERGNGLSDWNVEDISLEAWVSDLETVADAVGLEKFALLGISQGGPVAISYAVRHPERVSHLILYGTFALGWASGNPKSEELEKRRAQQSLIRLGWGQDNPAFRQLWTTLNMPDATPEQMQSFNDLQRASSSAENAARLFGAVGEIDVRDLLPEIEVPTLVLHARGDAVISYNEGRRVAAAIRGARFVTLESRNHVLLQHEPAWQKFMTEVQCFLGTDGIARQRSEAMTMSAKRCQTCGRLYTDETMNFCLDDGSSLLTEKIEVVSAEAAENSSGEFQPTLILDRTDPQ